MAPSKSIVSDNNTNFVTISKIPFAKAKLGEFVQDQPALGNQFLNDSLLQSYLRRHIHAEVALKLYIFPTIHISVKAKYHGSIATGMCRYISSSLKRSQARPLRPGQD